MAVDGAACIRRERPVRSLVLVLAGVVAGGVATSQGGWVSVTVEVGCIEVVVVVESASTAARANNAAL